MREYEVTLPVLLEGERLKVEGIRKALENPGAAPWRAVAWRELLLRILLVPGDFTSEDITAKAGQPPHPSQVGAFLSGAARAGILERVGFGKAQRANQHAALLSVWRATPHGEGVARWVLGAEIADRPLDLGLLP